MEPSKERTEKSQQKSAISFVVGFSAFVSWFVASFSRDSAAGFASSVFSPVCITFLGSICVALFAMVMLHEKLQVSFSSTKLLAFLFVMLVLGGVLHWYTVEVIKKLSLLSVLAASLSGLSIGCLLLCWGLVSSAAYSQAMPRNCLTAVVAAFAFAAVCSFLPSSVSAVLLYGVCPCLCFINIRSCYVRYGGVLAQHHAHMIVLHTDVSDTRHRIPSIMLLSMAMMWVAFGVVLNKWVLDLTFIKAGAVVTVDAVICAIIFVATLLSKNILKTAIGISSLFWFVVPLLIAGFVAINTGETIVQYVAYAALFLSMAISHMQLWSHFSWLTSRKDGIVPIQLFGWGWLFSVFGALLGMLISLVLSNISYSYVAYLIPVVASILTMALIFVRCRVENVGKETSKSKTKVDNKKEPQRNNPSHGDPFAARIQEIDKLNSLTPRELQVATLLAQGRSQPYISNALFISKSTVNTHVRHIYEKMGVRNKQELIEIVSPRQNHQ